MRYKLELDKTDLKIIKLLQEDGRRPYTEIANILKVSEGTIRTRVAKLLENKVIEIVVHADPDKIGLHTQAIIGLEIQIGKQDQVAEALLKFKEVRFVTVVSGAYDLIIQVYTRSNADLVELINNQLSKIDGILKTDVSIELKGYKDSFDLL